jgi:hypothetical protein
MAGLVRVPPARDSRPKVEQMEFPTDLEGNLLAGLGDGHGGSEGARGFDCADGKSAPLMVPAPDKKHRDGQGRRVLFSSRIPKPTPSRMSTPATPSAPKPAGDDRKLVSVDENYIAPSFEDKLHLFWEKNGKVVLALCVVVLLGIVNLVRRGSLR